LVTAVFLRWAFSGIPKPIMGFFILPNHPKPHLFPEDGFRK